MKCALRYLQRVSDAPFSYTASPVFEIHRRSAGLLRGICYHVHVLALLQARQQTLEGVWLLILTPPFCNHAEHNEQSVQMSLIVCISTSLLHELLPYCRTACRKRHERWYAFGTKLIQGAQMPNQIAYLGCKSVPQPASPALCQWGGPRRALAGGPIGSF